MAVRPRSPRRLPLVALVLTLALAGGCGGQAADGEPATENCREQWRDVAQTVYEMDSEGHPSAMAERWSTIIAGAEYQRDFGDGEDCTRRIDQTIESIDTLRRFSDRLRDFDMEYQLHVLAPQAELYLTDDRPRAVEGVRPPSKPKVNAAYQTLRERADDANEQLTPAWHQALSIDLDDPAQVSKAIKDLDRLAVSSPAFQECQAAITVLVRAISAQEAG